MRRQRTAITNAQNLAFESADYSSDVDKRWDNPKVEDALRLKRAAEVLRWDHPEQAAMLYGQAILFGLKILRSCPAEREAVLYVEAAADIAECLIDFGVLIQDSDPDLASYCFETAALFGNNTAFEHFINLWSEKDQSRATELVEKILASSDPELIYESACRLEDVGINVAIGMLKKATELGSADAPHECGKLLIRKTTKNKNEALRLFELAADRGNASAVLDLAEMIEEEDPLRAADLYECAIKDSGQAAAKLARLVKSTNPERALVPFDEMMRSVDIKSKNDYANEIDSIDPERARMLYEDAALVERADLGFYYSGIPKKRSGLPVRLMVSDMGGCNNDRYNVPHILVANDTDGKGDILGEGGFKVSLSKDPRVLEGENRLSAEDWASVKAFIAEKYDVLLDHWTHAEDQGSDDLYDLLFPDHRESSAREESLRIEGALALLDDGSYVIDFDGSHYASPLEAQIATMCARIEDNLS